MPRLLLCAVLFAMPAFAVAEETTKAPAATTAPGKPFNSGNRNSPKFETRKKPPHHQSAGEKAKTENNIPAEGSSDLVNTMTGSGTAR